MSLVRNDCFLLFHTPVFCCWNWFVCPNYHFDTLSAMHLPSLHIQRHRFCFVTGIYTYHRVFAMARQTIPSWAQSYFSYFPLKGCTMTIAFGRTQVICATTSSFWPRTTEVKLINGSMGGIHFLFSLCLFFF